MSALNSSVNRITANTEKNRNQYTPKRSSGASFGKARNTAYTRAGIEVPKTANDILPVLLAAEPTASEVVTRVLAETTTDKDLQKGIADVQRAQAIDALKAAQQRKAQSLSAAMTPAKADDVNEALKALAPLTTKATKAIYANAGVLPDHPFDMAGVIQLDVAKEMKLVHTALSDLSLVASVLPSGQTSTLGSEVNDIAVVVEVPHVQPEQVSGIANVVHRDDESHIRSAVRRLQRDIIEEGADRVIVDVARGVYGDEIKLSMVKDVSEYRKRVTAFESSYERRTVAVRETGRVSGMVIPADLR